MLTPVLRSNLGVLFKVWRLGQSGVLRLLACEPDGLSRVVPVARGGLLDQEAWGCILDSLTSHRFSMEERPSGATGNRKLMGTLILTACRRFEVLQSELLTLDLAVAEAQPQQPMRLMPAISLHDLDLLHSAAKAEGGGQQSELLTRGRELMSRGLFEEADSVLSMARDLRMDHGPTLACLAQARFNNTSRSADERVRDAESLLQLARLLAPSDPEVALAQRQILDSSQSARDSRRREIIAR